MTVHTMHIFKYCTMCYCMG